MTARELIVSARKLTYELRRLAGKEPEHPPEDDDEDLSWLPPDLRYVAVVTYNVWSSPWGQERHQKWLDARAARGVLWN